MRSLLATTACIASLLVLARPTTALRAEDSLSQLRDEVRTEDPPSPSRDRANDHRAASYNPSFDPSNPDTNSDNWDSAVILTGLGVAGVAASAPFWAPPMLIGDSRLMDGYFPRYPYKQRGGYMWIDD